VKTVQWNEPRAYRRAIRRQASPPDPKEPLKIAAGVFVAMLLLRALVALRPDPDAHPPGWELTLAVAAAFALTAAYGMPQLSALVMQNVVLVSDKGVNCNTAFGGGVRLRYWSWDQIAYCVYWTSTAEGSPRPVLSLMSADGETLETFAVAPNVDMEALRAVIARNARELRTA
jgi:hypothetical protein